LIRPSPIVIVCGMTINESILELFSAGIGPGARRPFMGYFVAWPRVGLRRRP
jgi:TRAP-type C4-dicarboxylate transport system permease large subunit